MGSIFSWGRWEVSHHITLYCPIRCFREGLWLCVTLKHIVATSIKSKKAAHWFVAVVQAYCLRSIYALYVFYVILLGEKKSANKKTRMQLLAKHNFGQLFSRQQTFKIIDNLSQFFIIMVINFISFSFFS